MRKDAVDKASIEKAASMVRKEADKALSGAKELASEENVEKVKDFAKSLGTPEGREKAAESARQAANASKIWFLAFWNDVKTHFKPKGNCTGVAAWISRVLNLWTCGLNGKIACIVPVLVAGWVMNLFMSGSSCPVKELVGYKLGDVYDGPLDSQLCMVAERMEGWWNVEKKIDFRDFGNVALAVTPKTHRIAGIIAGTGDPIRDTEQLKTELLVLEKLFKDKYGAKFTQLTKESFIWIADEHKCVVKIFYMNWGGIGWAVFMQLYCPDLVDLLNKESSEIAKEKLEKEAARSASGL